MSCSIHPQWVHDREDCPMCSSDRVKRRRKILVKDVNDEYDIAEWVTTVENADEEFIEVYKVREHYHTLESALRDL
jgi:hypothetical protein